MSKQILVETSARHVHVTEEDLHILFGDDMKLEVKKMLSQPGMFVSTQKVDLIGPKSTIKNVSILGPCRNASQVEISLTDARSLGITVPIRESGDHTNTPGITIVNSMDPSKMVNLKEGLIVAKRHIHMTEEDALEFGVKNGDIVSVKIDSTERRTIFNDVVIRVSNNFALAMHIDTDESNAASASGVVFGELVK